MRRRVVAATLTLAVGTMTGALGNQILTAQPPPVTRTTFQQKDLEGAEGRRSSCTALISCLAALWGDTFTLARSSSTCWRGA